MPKKSSKERVQQIQDTVTRLVNSLQLGELGPEEFQQQNDELQALLAELSQQIDQEQQEHEHHINELCDEQSSTVRIIEIEQRITNTTNKLKQTKEEYQAFLDKQSALIDRLSQISEKPSNVLKENGFFTKTGRKLPQGTPNNAQEAQSSQPAVTR